MKPRRATAGQSQVAREILAYLAEHPEAQDTVEGIVEWWLMEQQIKRGVAQVKDVLTELVTQGLVLERKGRDGRMHYRMNRRKAGGIQLKNKCIKKKSIIAVFTIVVSMFLSGCAQPRCCMSFPVQGSQGSIHYVVFGFGIVSVPKTDEKSAILATKVQALGVNVSNQPGLKLGIGYSSGTVVTIPHGAEDVHIEVSQKPGGPLKVETQKATLADR